MFSGEWKIRQNAFAQVANQFFLNPARITLAAIGWIVHFFFFRFSQGSCTFFALLFSLWALQVNCNSVSACCLVCQPMSLTKRPWLSRLIPSSLDHTEAAGKSTGWACWSFSASVQLSQRRVPLLASLPSNKQQDMTLGDLGTWEAPWMTSCSCNRVLSRESPCAHPACKSNKSRAWDIPLL